jgi:hypothetical protein
MVYIVSQHTPCLSSDRLADMPLRLLDEQLLRKRITELQDYRRLGILTASDASRYEKMRVERVSCLLSFIESDVPVAHPFDGYRWPATERLIAVSHGSHRPSPNARSGGLRTDKSMFLPGTAAKQEQTLTPIEIYHAPVRCPRVIVTFIG